MPTVEIENELGNTQSLCPVCMKVVEARKVVRNGAVYLIKTCPDHGAGASYYWPDADHFRWMQAFRLPFKKPQSQIATSKSCPYDCGLCASHLRHATLVEIEVTQRCNLRCPVCFMAAGGVSVDPTLETIQSMFQNILQQCTVSTSIQLTGGEPTVHRDLPEIIRMGREAGFSAIEINTNGVLIGSDAGMIERLARAGISGIYLQFDGLTREVYQKIRGADLLEIKLRAIENCRTAGVQVVLAMTVIQGINHDQLGEVLDFALKNQDVIAGVAYQPAFGSGRFEVQSERRLTMGDVIFMLSDQSNGVIQPYDLWPLGCSHSLCSCATYLVNDGEKTTPFTRMITPMEYSQSFDPESPQGSVFADIAARKFPELETGLSVVIMNYMDVGNIDLERLKECSMTVTMEDGRSIPFCAYQMTDINGNRLYPVWGRV